MLLQIIAIPLGLFSLIFMLVNLSRLQRVRLGGSVTGPAEAGPARQASVCGIAEPDDPPGDSPVTGKPALWLRAFRTTQGLAFTRSSNSRHVQRIGKVTTRFRLVDENNPASYLIVDSNKVSEIDVLVTNKRFCRDGAPMATTAAGDDFLKATLAFFDFHLNKKEGMEEKAIYPGDRIWAYGKIREKDGQRILGGWGAWLDDRPPEQRIAWHTGFAKGGAIGIGAAGFLLLVSLLL
jgi:hypothetical protein